MEDRKPNQVSWYCSYLTLEIEKPTAPTEFRPITYEPLREILVANPELSPGLFAAQDCLCSRLDDYYEARTEVVDGATLPNDAYFEDYLSDTWGLIDRTNRFYWLMRRITKDIVSSRDVELWTVPIVVQNRGFSNPGCQIRGLRWQAEKPYDIEGKTPSLEKCFDIHLELQLSRECNVDLVLHYETMPYMTGLNNRSDIPIKQRERYWQQRKRFANVLDSDEPKKHGWKVHIPRDWGYPPPQTRNQLAKFSANSDPNGKVSGFSGWVQKGIESLLPSVEHAGERTLW